MRGLLLDLLVTGDHERTTAAMEHYLKVTAGTDSQPAPLDLRGGPAAGSDQARRANSLSTRKG
jgi:hypothetical protein